MSAPLAFDIIRTCQAKPTLILKSLWHLVCLYSWCICFLVTFLHFIWMSSFYNAMVLILPFWHLTSFGPVKPSLLWSLWHLPTLALGSTIFDSLISFLHLTSSQLPTALTYLLRRIKVAHRITAPFNVAFPPPKAPKPLASFLHQPFNSKEHAVSLFIFHSGI